MRAAARPDPVSTADRLALTDLVHRYAAHVDDGLFDVVGIEQEPIAGIGEY